MSQSDWDDRYLSGDTPWDTGKPNDHLVEFLRFNPFEHGQALDVGCGTGSNSLWLAEQGFTVLGIDVSSIAIEKARARAADAGVDCRFAVADFLCGDIAGGPFDIVFDLGCFHLFDKPEERKRFAGRAAALLKHGGRWLSLIGSTEGPERDYGPPRRTAREVVGAVEPVLEILEFRSIELHANLPTPAAAWLCLSRPRLVPAQQSTQRS